MTRGEAERLTALVEDAVRPGAELPRVRETDAVAALGRWLDAGPRRNALALRLTLRLRGRVAAADDVLRRLALHCYYGDAAVMRALGYDADAVVARAAAVRAAQARP